VLYAEAELCLESKNRVNDHRAGHENISHFINVFGLPLYCSRLQQSSHGTGSPMVIRKDRPSVYIEFQGSGKATPLFDGEKEERIWLKLYNNRVLLVRR
jgi:hypothetical protein